MQGSGRAKHWLEVETAQERAAQEGYQQWIENQKGAEGQDIHWLYVTFKIRGGNLHTSKLQKVLRETMKRFEIKVLGGNAVMRHGDRLRLATAFGGEPKVGRLMHYHARLEFRTRWEDVEASEFVRLLDTEWQRQLNKVNRLGEVWAIHGSWDTGRNWRKYDRYTVRDEGTTLPSGMSKVDMGNLYLRVSRPQSAA